jgi:putative peptide zinc metalloprotease protein
MSNIARAPARPDGLELIGEMAGSGYRTPPSLVRRSDGQTLQLTPLLYAIVEAVDGRRDYAQIAQVVSTRTGRSIAASDVETLVEQQLRPRGLLLRADGTTAALKRSNPLTGLRFKLAVTNPSVTRAVTAPFAALFHWWIGLPLLIVFAWISWWLLMDHGVASATYHAFTKPSLLLAVVVVTILSAGFHEFGHAAAARRGGAQPGVMGAGLYLLWPAFYTDVTDTYRLGRLGRVRTDLGGLYFNAIVAVAITAIWWFSGWDALLLVVVAQILQMVRQLTPLVRFDGYHVLADLTGVPDLFSRIGPILASFWPTRWHDPRVAGLRWWARLLVTGWVLVVVPILVFSILALLLAAPRLIGTAWASMGREWSDAAVNWSAGRNLDAVGGVLAVGAVALPVVAMGMIVSRLVGRGARTVWRRTAGRPMRRTGAGLLAAGLAAVVALAWWPTPDRYRPVQPYEGGTLLDVAGMTLAAAGVDLPAPPPVRGGELVTVLPSGEPLPTEDEPQMAMVLVPSGSTASPAGTSPEDTTAVAAEPAWVFPFNEPLPPEPGDNQALAVNTTDGTATYDVAVAMVWVTDDDPVLNVNEAYAFASCSDCVTVSVAFQVVVIVGSADVVVPQNLSAAVNYDCFRCITASVASQLVLTVDALPGVEQQVALADVWDEITAFAGSIPAMPLADVITRLEGFKGEIVSILGVAPLAAPVSTAVPPAPSDTPGTPTPAVTPTAEPSGSARTDAPSPTVTPVPASAPSRPTAAPATSGAPEATPSPTPESTNASTDSSEPSPSPS